MVAGAFFFSLMALIVKLLNKFGTYELVFWRSVFMFAGAQVDTDAFLFRIVIL